MWALSIIGCLVVVYLCKRFISYFLLLKKTRQYGCLPPPSYPHKDLLFGLDLFKANMQARRHGNLNALERSRFSLYGKTYEASSWGSRMILTMDEENIRSALSVMFNNFGVESLRLSLAEPCISKGVFTTDGAFWEKSRQLIRPIFSRSQVTDLNALEVHVKRFFQRVPKDGSTLDLQSLLKLMHLDHSTEMIFGKATKTLLTSTLTENENELLRTYSDVLRQIGLRVVLGRIRHLDFSRTMNRLAQKVHSVMDKYIDEAIERRKRGKDQTRDSSTRNRYVFVDELVSLSDDREEIRHQLLNIFLPARDAIALGLSGILWHLVRRPDVWSRLRAEVLAVKEPLTYSVLQALPYMRAVINESLRLTTPAGRNIRVCLKPTVLPRGGGPDGSAPIFLDKGDQITLNFSAMHRDPALWGPNASEFDPQRWLEPDAPQRTWQYIPFSAGPRVCPGRQISLVEMSYILARMVGEWEAIENRDDVNVFIEEYRLTTESRRGVKVGVKWASRS